MPANKTAEKKATVTEKKLARKAPAKKATGKKATAKKATARSVAPVAHGAATTTVKRGDLIVVDSVKVGAQPREGEVLQVIHRDLRVSYRVKWADGNETLFSPALGSARFVRA